ncbi:MAG: preprotein translocase subunit SecG [Phycisphaerae bacterium]
MLALGFWGGLLSIALITVSLLLIGIVLLQKNRGAGLSGAFGGVGGHSAFGTKTGDFLTWVTVVMVVVFLSLNIAGTFVFEPPAEPEQSAPLVETGGPADNPTKPNTGANQGANPTPLRPVQVPPGPAPTSK